MPQSAAFFIDDTLRIGPKRSTLKNFAPSAARENEYSNVDYADEIFAVTKLNYLVFKP